MAGRRGPKTNPTKLTEQVAETIVGYVRAGNFLNVAAAAAGVSPSIVYDWIMTGETGGPLKPRPIHRRFAAAFREAEAAAEAHAVLVVRKAINEGDARAAIEYLRRRHPERWGDRSQQTVDHRMQLVGAASPQELAAFAGEGELIDAEAYEVLEQPIDRHTGQLTRVDQWSDLTRQEQDVDIVVDVVQDEARVTPGRADDSQVQ